ncbi:MAG: MFS transporter [Bulleidia sp.]|nr:MFS transporter [Bulleidia sp.]
MKQTKLSAGTWTAVILFGLIGQIAWSIENMEFNLFLFNYIGGTTTDIARMVAWSALVSTLTTLVMGIVTDRLGHRKEFLCYGYVIWGVMTMLFALISRERTVSMFPSLTAAQVLARTAFMVILMDCIMSFFGSAANDASFNAWVTESTDETNRASVEGVLNVFPLLSMLIVAGASGIFVERAGWPAFFLLTGGVVSVCGLLGLLFVKEPEHISGERMNFIQSVIYGFRPSVMKENRDFYVTLLALLIFNTAVQIFMPYLLIYLEKTLQFDTMTYSIVMAVVILLASVVSVIIGRITDNIGHEKLARWSVFLFAVGLMLASMVRIPVLFIIAGTIMMSGYVSILVIFTSALRDYTPVEHVGMFQGIRLCAYVLVPMVVGPAIGSFLINHSDAGTYVNGYGETVNLPVPAIFVAAAAVSLFILLPASRLFKAETKEGEE